MDNLSIHNFITFIKYKEAYKKGSVEIMGKFLDSQSSQNASYDGSISIPITATPALFGTLGLNVADAGPNLRVQFAFTATASAIVTVATSINIDIYRGVGAGRVLVYSATAVLPVLGLGVLSSETITLTGSDFNPPAPNNFLIYQAFISVPAGTLILPTRTGPENFYAAAYSD